MRVVRSSSDECISSLMKNKCGLVLPLLKGARQPYHSLIQETCCQKSPVPFAQEIKNGFGKETPMK